MAGTALLARPAGRGRQPVEVERQRDLADELVAERAESRILATRVLQIGTFLAGGPKPPAATINLGGELVHLASRRLRQISSSVL